MTNAQASIAAEKQRERVPTVYLVQFEEITNVELASMCTGDSCPTQWKAYAGWELEYREAFRIDVYYDAETDAIKRRHA